MGIEPMYRALQSRHCPDERPGQALHRALPGPPMGTLWEHDRPRRAGEVIWPQMHHCVTSASAQDRTSAPGANRLDRQFGASDYLE
jgi:hypothetical protein